MKRNYINKYISFIIHDTNRSIQLCMLLMINCGNKTQYDVLCPCTTIISWSDEISIEQNKKWNKRYEKLLQVNCHVKWTLYKQRILWVDEMKKKVIKCIFDFAEILHVKLNFNYDFNWNNFNEAVIDNSTACDCCWRIGIAS